MGKNKKENKKRQRCIVTADGRQADRHYYLVDDCPCPPCHRMPDWLSDRTCKTFWLLGNYEMGGERRKGTYTAAGNCFICFTVSGLDRPLYRWSGPGENLDVGNGRTRHCSSVAVEKFASGRQYVWCSRGPAIAGERDRGTSGQPASQYCRHRKPLL